MTKTAIIDAVIGETKIATYEAIKVSPWQILTSILKTHPESEELIRPTELDPNLKNEETKKLIKFIADEYKRKYDIEKRKAEPDYEGLPKERALRDTEMAIDDYNRKMKLRSENTGYKELQSYKDLLQKYFRDSTSHQQSLNGTIEFTIEDVHGVTFKYFYNNGIVRKMNPSSVMQKRNEIAHVTNLDEGFKAIALDMEKHNKRKPFQRKPRWSLIRQ